ncbi:MAG: thiamine pyrophosphate-dependent dehydrogenase E1 component subunit alpha [Streptomycetaceae bacterium]|nr:MAG: thiamine pyrophosphate-dependent dehydrogenase E1 component subunit alpha [Streptomycetaceae bacterium]
MTTSLERRNSLYGDDLACYERMVEIREFEKITNALFAAGSIRGTTHLAIGQEALTLGMASVLKPTDVVAATYRSHAIGLALGLSPASVLAEIMGKATGCCGGVGGSMHLCDTSIGLLPTSAIIGAGIPVAAGAALAFQVQKTSQVAVALFGDGATNIGAFHEGLNLAAIWKLPVIFVCDNNVYGEYSRIEKTTPIEDLHIRAESYAMPHMSLDGMDIHAVRKGLTEAVERARSGGGPTLIEAKTYRFSGHSRADQALYRPEGELEAWQKRDPLLVTENDLISRGLITAEKIESMKAEMITELTSLSTRVADDPEPELSAMFSNIWTPTKAEK